MTINESENDDSDVLQALYSVYKKNQGNSFSILNNLFKQRHISVLLKVINI